MTRLKLNGDSSRRHLQSKHRTMKKKSAIIVLLFLSLALPFEDAAAKNFNVLNYGARGDGATLDTAAIQQTIDAAANDGGQVLIPRKKTFLVSTLNLKGGIDFHLEGTLLISTNQSD